MYNLWGSCSLQLTRKQNETGEVVSNLFTYAAVGHIIFDWTVSFLKAFYQFFGRFFGCDLPVSYIIITEAYTQSELNDIAKTRQIIKNKNKNKKGVFVMKKQKMELIVTFAKLWGITTVEDFNNKGEMYQNLEAYDAEELVKLLSTWADEYLQGDFDDTGDFFDDKMTSLISSFSVPAVSNRYPVLYGYAGQTTKELKSVQEVAEFIIKYGVEEDVIITREGHVFFLDTFGIHINRIVDLEYREELLKVLVPMQLALTRKE